MEWATTFVLNWLQCRVVGNSNIHQKYMFGSGSSISRISWFLRIFTIKDMGKLSWVEVVKTPNLPLNGINNCGSNCFTSLKIGRNPCCSSGLSYVNHILYLNYPIIFTSSDQTMNFPNLWDSNKFRIVRWGLRLVCYWFWESKIVDEQTPPTEIPRNKDVKHRPTGHRRRRICSARVWTQILWENAGRDGIYMDSCPIDSMEHGWSYMVTNSKVDPAGLRTYLCWFVF